MTTLQNLAIYTGIGSTIFVLTSVAFGIAVRRRTIGIAPRCSGRPKDVIYNPNPTDDCQNRGSPTWGWYKWTLGLTYDMMMDGVPGTGTRNNGLEGRMLRCNLDQIVLLRFHAICLRVGVLATIIFLVIILPINVHGGCEQIRDEFVAAEEIKNLTGCVIEATDFEKTTITNIPALIEEVCDFSDTGEQGCAEYVIRYCVIVLCTWVVNFYTCVLLRREWIRILAMRRKYYLELDVWSRRKEELEETLLSTDTSQQIARKRDPWIPHPEIRETTPNIQLYSILIGGLPANPEDAVDDVEAVVAFSKKHSIDWQLDITKTFFDKCVPTQPGFSSSVAAVTILPGAKELAVTWKKWNAHASALRRLRFIRTVIAERKGSSEHDEENAAVSKPKSTLSIGKRSLLTGIDEEEPVDTPENSTVSPRSEYVQSNARSKRSIFRESIRNKNYYKQILGTNTDAEVEAHLLDNLAFHPEQTASYSRELAQSASGCCPNGFNERRVRKASMDELILMEQDATQNVQEAFDALHEAQDAAKTSITKISEDSQRSRTALDSDVSITDGSMSRLTVTGDDDMVPSFDGSGDDVEGLEIEEGDNGAGEAAFRESVSLKTADYVSNRFNHSGGWKLPSIGSVLRRGGTKVKKGGKKIAKKGEKIAKKGGEFAHASQERVLESVKSGLVRESCYAVVTFTSRQAAVAARQTLLDGRASSFWLAEESIPVPPLADAAVCSGGRNLCRPVTLSIPEAQKAHRFHITVVILAATYLFYTIPLAAVSAWSNPETWEGIFPNISEVAEENWLVQQILAFLPGLIYTLFFAVVPQFFKLLANFGSYARSVVEAEYSALQFYWWFMNVSAFWGATLGNVLLHGLDGSTVGAEVRETVVEIANTVPTTISSTWLFWMLTRLTMTLPLNYQLQLNTYLFNIFGLKCLSRANRGGGPGGPVPYRIFIDTGVVFLCLVALAPVCPLIAPAALFNFLYISPLLRRNIIFVYRPKFDAGGIRWPFLFQMMMSALLTGQVVLAIVIGLRGRQYAASAAVLAALQFPPTLFFRRNMMRKYYKSFKDAALMQTSLLDGWNTEEETSIEKREEFRNFLVDAHKAAYVPVCVAGGTTRIVTAEPATVVPCAADRDQAPANPNTSSSLSRSLLRRSTSIVIPSMPEESPSTKTLRKSLFRRSGGL